MTTPSQTIDYLYNALSIKSMVKLKISNQYAH